MPPVTAESPKGSSSMAMSYPFSTETYSAHMTEQIGAAFAASLPEGLHFLAMYGDLGAGKTAFVRGMASVLTPDARVSSPTYALINEYRSDDCLFLHFDMYRITDDDDLCSTGFYDYLEGTLGERCRRVVIAAEWSENIGWALPARRYDIHILRLEGAPDAEGNEKRRIEIIRREDRA